MARETTGGDIMQKMQVHVQCARENEATHPMPVPVTVAVEVSLQKEKEEEENRDISR